MIPIMLMQHKQSIRLAYLAYPHTSKSELGIVLILLYSKYYKPLFHENSLIYHAKKGINQHFIMTINIELVEEEVILSNNVRDTCILYKPCSMLPTNRLSSQLCL